MATDHAPGGRQGNGGSKRTGRARTLVCEGCRPPSKNDKPGIHVHQVCFKFPPCLPTARLPSSQLLCLVPGPLPHYSFLPLLNLS
jgi:hypothetical protein